MNWHNLAIMWTGVFGVAALLSFVVWITALDANYDEASKPARLSFPASLAGALVLGSLLAGGVV